jgi:hypothetical protein
MDLKGMGCDGVDRICLALDREAWQAVVTMIMFVGFDKWLEIS